jgi:hypothetical protein
MPTKAELEAELEALKQELAARAKEAARTASDFGDKTAGKDLPGGGPAALADLLKSHGIDVGELDLDQLWKQLSGDVGSILKNHPALGAITVFTLGFLLGRASR